MAKGKSTWKYNKLLTPRRRYFTGGGPLELLDRVPQQTSITTHWEMPSKEVLDSQFKANVEAWKRMEAQKTAAGNTGNNMNIAGLAGAAFADISNMVSNIQATGVEEQKKSLMSKVKSSQLGLQPKGYSFDQLISDYGNTATLDNVTAKDLGAKSTASVIGGTLAGGLRGSMSGFGFAKGGQLRKVNKYMGGGPIGAIIGGVMGTATSLIGDLIYNQKAKKAANEVNQQIAYTNAFNERSLANRANNLVNDQMFGLQANYSALGGPIEGAIDYGFMNNWLDIKREEAEGKNKFLTSMPNSFAYGGRTHGADFTNGLVAINNGGSHESNPFEGVPMGVDQEGVPNLVEEGETIVQLPRLKDYVMSARLRVPRGLRDKYHLGGPISFADASKQLAKESEERPNDPISQRGMQALMADLANAQEELKASQEERSFALGGNLFKDGGGKWAHNNTSNDSTMANHAMFAPYFKDGKFDFNAMHADGSSYRQALDVLARILYKRKQNPNYQYTDVEKKALEGYLGNVRSWNGGRGYNKKGIDELSYDKIIGDSLTTTDGNTFTFNSNAKRKGLALDGMRGGHYYGAAGIDGDWTNSAKYGVHHMLRNANGEPTKLEDSEHYYDGTRNGYTWEERFGNKYKRVNNGVAERTYDKDGYPIDTYYYDLVEQAKDEAAKNHWVRIKQADNTYGDAILFDDAKRQGLLEGYQAGATGKEGDDDLTYYDPLEKTKMGKYADWLRYAPAVGFGIGAVTDALGLTNKPDFSNADALLEASRGAGTYQPVSFNPIGDYLTYKPFDREFYINQQNAQSGAVARNIMNTSGGNRATAMAGLLANGYNSINGIGSLARQAEEYNLAQRSAVGEFNRTTNLANSEGLLRAAMANQDALAKSGELRQRGTIEAYKMKELERQTADANRSANLSGLFQTLGDIGFEERNARMRDWGIQHEIYGPGTEGYGRTRRASKGGKIKRRKRGLTV